MNLLGGFILFKMAQNFVGSFAEAVPDAPASDSGGGIIGFLLWWGFAICVYIFAGLLVLAMIGGVLFVLYKIGIVLLAILGVLWWPFQELIDFVRIVLF